MYHGIDELLRGDFQAAAFTLTQSNESTKPVN